MRTYILSLILLTACGTNYINVTDDKPKTYYYVKDDKPTLCESFEAGGVKYWSPFASMIKIIDSENAEYHQAGNDGIMPLKISKDLTFSNNDNSVTYNNIKHEFGKKLADIPEIKTYYYVKDDQPTLCDKTSLGRGKNWSSYTSRIIVFDSETAEFHQACNDNSSPLKVEKSLIFSNNNNSVTYHKIRHDFGKKLPKKPQN